LGRHVSSGGGGGVGPTDGGGERPGARLEITGIRISLIDFPRKIWLVARVAGVWDVNRGASV